MPPAPPPRSRSAAFLQAIRPVLASGDPESLAATTLASFQPTDLVRFLTDADPEARQAAAFVLGFVGGAAEAGPLMRCLHAADADLVRYAENSLWSIWFREGRECAAEPFTEGVTALAEERHAEARTHLEEAVRRDPEFAEAHNQLAICLYIGGHYTRSLACCERVVELMPAHFGAWAGMGHCHLHRGSPDRAIQCYRRALAIHPRLDSIRAALSELLKQRDN